MIKSSDKYVKQGLCYIFFSRMQTNDQDRETTVYQHRCNLLTDTLNFVYTSYPVSRSGT